MRVEKGNTDLTILVNSCDDYSDLWFPFFSLLKKNWPNCNYKIFLNTESKKYTFDDSLNIICLQLYKNNSIDWSTRLIETIKQINTDYVLCILDDEFIMKPVLQKKLDRLISIMRLDKRISAIILDPPFVDEVFPLLPKSKIHKGLCPIPFARYNYNSANAAIWRKKRLLHYLKSGETPWQFEVNVKYRLLYFDKFYYCEKSYNPIVTSFLRECGYGLVKGKWLWKDKQLFDSYGISVDYSKRGILSLDQVEVDMFKSAQIAMYKKESQRTKIEVFTDFLDRYRDIAPAWMHSLKNFLNRINPMRFFKKE